MPEGSPGHLQLPATWARRRQTTHPNRVRLLIDFRVFPLLRCACFKKRGALAPILIACAMEFAGDFVYVGEEEEEEEVVEEEMQATVGP